MAQKALFIVKLANLELCSRLLVSGQTFFKDSRTESESAHQVLFLGKAETSKQLLAKKLGVLTIHGQKVGPKLILMPLQHN